MDPWNVCTSQSWEANITIELKEDISSGSIEVMACSGEHGS